MILREIKKSFGRFFAIFAIIAIGVGFFSGVRITTPVLVNTVDGFYKKTGFFDLKLLSTLGWEDEDVDKVKKLDGVKEAEGSVTYDIIVKRGEDSEDVFKVHSITKGINGLIVRKGRLPEKDDEIFLESHYSGTYDVGDEFILASENEKEDKDHFKYDKYKITGFGDSSLYINFERGTSSLGNGTVSGFAYILPGGFEEDIYTEVYVKLEGDEKLFSDAYDDKIDAVMDKWEDDTKKIATERYERIYKEADEKLSDAKEEFEEKKADGQKELDDAKKDIENGEEELSDALKDLSKGERDLRKAEDDIKSGKEELTDAGEKLKNAEYELKVNEDKLMDAKAQLDEAATQIEANESALNEAKAGIEQYENALSATKSELDAKSAELESAKAFMDEMTYQAALSQINAGFSRYEEALKDLNEKKAQYEAGVNALNAGKAEYEAALAGYNAGLAAWAEGRKEYLDGVKEYEDGKKEFDDGLKEYEDGKKKVADGWDEYNDGLKELEDGKKEYEDGKKEFDEKIKDAEEEIEDAEEELEDLSDPDTFVIERNTNLGCSCFEGDSEIVAQIAKVFPIFFILVAALVCMTTMTRMVEEQRGQIGTLKALGYSNFDIMGIFSFYSGSAALLGCVIGYFLGIYIFPTVIWMSYQMMYIDIPLKLMIDPLLFAAMVAVSLLCSLGSTYISCRYELFETAASLMRPKAPRPGKRVFLEYIPFIWKRLKFTQKVSVRNIFRYKRRLLMMVVGISGSCALLLTGFGMKDSVANFAADQYDDIQIADGEMIVKNGKKDALPKKVEAYLKEGDIDHILLKESSWDLKTEDKVKSVNVIAPLSYEDMDRFFILKDEKGDRVDLPKKGSAIISVSLSKRYDIQKGDTIHLNNEDMEQMDLKVTGIFQNHVYNYVMISPEERAEDKVNAAYFNVSKVSDVYQVTAGLSKLKSVSYVNVFEDFKHRIGNMMKSLDYIVLLVIFSSAGLSFVVLYNLTNINITERVREIATIKVLGFYPRETSAYVFRENIFLTILGTIAGLFLGILLHRYVISRIVVDMVFFKVSIKRISFFYSILLTIFFTLFVNFIMGGKLEKISMTESLKSVE